MCRTRSSLMFLGHKIPTNLPFRNPARRLANPHRICVHPDRVKRVTRRRRVITRQTGTRHTGTCTPVLKQRRLLAVGSNGVGLMPPGESSVAPKGIPTGPTEDAIPGMPSGDVAPIA
jgi:hypothetical protein